MRIEERWIDCGIYFVGFYVKVNDSGLTRLVKKTLVFDSEDFGREDPEGDIARFIHANFTNVMKVDSIDIWTEDSLRPRFESKKSSSVLSQEELY